MPAGLGAGAGDMAPLSKGNNRAIREVNRSIILDLVRRDRRISRTELARRSKLTKPTVSTIVDELIADGVVHEVGFGESVSGAGGRRGCWSSTTRRPRIWALHFGVRQTTVAVADARGPTSRCAARRRCTGRRRDR